MPQPYARAAATDNDENPFSTRMLNSIITASNARTAEHIPRTRSTLLIVPVVRALHGCGHRISPERHRDGAFAASLQRSDLRLPGVPHVLGNARSEEHTSNSSH